MSAAVNREANIVNGAIGVYPTTPWGDIIPPFTYKDGDEISWDLGWGISKTSLEDHLDDSYEVED